MPNKSIKLTTAAILKLKPSKDRYEVADTATNSPRLRLVVGTSGCKTFSMRFRGVYRQANVTLGQFDPLAVEADAAPVIGQRLSLTMARRLALDVHRQRALGVDTVGERQRARLEKRAGQAKTFSQAVLDHTAQYLQREQRRWQASARMLGVIVGDDGALTMLPRGLASRWRDRPLATISADDVHHVVDEVREKGVPGLERRNDEPSESMARVMYTVLSRLFSWLLETRRISVNPMRDVSAPKASDDRDRVLTNAEVRAFWVACDDQPEPVRQCLRLLLLFGCRRDEIGMLRRAEINDADGTVTISASRAKNGRAHVIPMSPLMRDILASVKTNGSDQVFCTGRGLAWSRIKAQLDDVLKFETPFRLHDVRRTFATGLASIGVEPHIVEACLNHQSGAKASVAGTYNRYAYADEKRAAFARWSDHIVRLVEGRAARVVPMKRKGARAV